MSAEEVGCVSFFFSSRRRHTRLVSDWSSDVCSSDLCPDRNREAWQPCCSWGVESHSELTSLPCKHSVQGSSWGWAAATGVLWGLSYFFWRRLQAMPASA